MARTTTEAQEAILKEIVEKAPSHSPDHILALAEAWAWLQSPNQSHGGGTTS